MPINTNKTQVQWVPHLKEIESHPTFIFFQLKFCLVFQNVNDAKSTNFLKRGYLKTISKFTLPFLLLLFFFDWVCFA